MASFYTIVLYINKQSIKKRVVHYNNDIIANIIDPKALQPLLQYYLAHPSESWSKQQTLAYNMLGADKYIGQEAHQFIQSLLKVKNIQSRRDKFNGYLNQLSTFESKINSLASSMKLIPELNSLRESHSYNNQVIFVFKESVNVNNLKELEKSTKMIQNLMRDISALVGENESEFVVLDIEKGSLFVTISAIAVTIAATATFVHHTLSSVEKIISLKNTYKNAKDNGYSEKILEQMEVEASDFSKNECKRISLIVMKEHGADVDKETKNELMNRAEITAKEIQKFLLSGGIIKPQFSTDDQELVDEEVIISIENNYKSVEKLLKTTKGTKLIDSDE